jgi:hypothetical protein
MRHAESNLKKHTYFDYEYINELIQAKDLAF